MLEKDVAYRAPEVAPVGGEGMLVVGVDISFLRSLDVVQGDWGVFVVVKWRQEAWLHAGVQGLHLGRVEAEIVTAEGAHSDQLHLSLEYIDEHRELVKPGPAQQFAPAVHAVVARELASFLEAFVLEQIRLQVLGVRVHRAELVNTDHIAVVADTVELHERAVGRIVVPDGGAELSTENIEFTVVKTLVDHFKASPVHPPQELHAVVCAVLSLGHPEIEPSRPFKLRAYAVPDVVTEIYQFSGNAGMRFVYDLSLKACGA